MFRGSVFASAALALTVAPIAAQAAPQEVAGPAELRTSSVLGASEQVRGTTLWVVLLIALGLAIWGGTKLLDDDPSSP